jgi:hypothetical protein
MSKKQFYVFGDESGCWKPNQNQLYVRSWVKIEYSIYNKLNNHFESLICQIKPSENELGKDDKFEIKWKKAKSLINENNLAMLNILNLPVSVFITVTIPSCAIERIHKWKTYQAILNIDESDLTGYMENSTYHGSFPEITKTRLLAVVESFLFMNIYEKQHVENAKNFFMSNSLNCTFVIDKPDSCVKELRPIIYECMEIVDSKKEYGVWLADIIAGCFQGLLNTSSEDYLFCKDVYEQFIKPKLIYHETIKNPNIIFYQDPCITELADHIRKNIWGVG